MKHEIYLGFREIPSDLEKFLVEQGYEKTSDEGEAQDYEHGDLGSPQIFYFQTAEERKGSIVPNWRNSPVPIVAELEIVYNGGDARVSHKTYRLVDLYRFNIIGLPFCC